MKLKTVSGRGVRPGVDLNNSDKLLDAMGKCSRDAPPVPVAAPTKDEQECYDRARRKAEADLRSGFELGGKVPPNREDLHRR